MRPLPDNFEDVQCHGSPLAYRVLQTPWIEDLNFGPRAFWALWSAPVFSLTTILTLIIGVSMHSWWALASYGVVFGVGSVALAHRNRRRYRTDPQWRSARVLLDRAERIREVIRVFQLHCGFYREWYREVSLGLREGDDERTDRYYDTLDRAKRILENTILQTDFLARRLKEGIVLTDEMQSPPSLTLAIEGVDTNAARALQEGDAFDPTFGSRCEAAMDRVLGDLSGMRALRERT